MARLSFRDRFFTRPVSNALTSPWSILLFGAATAAGIIAGVPIAIAGVIGAAAYAGKVAFAVPRNQRTDKIDPFTLKEPWRGYVSSAQASKARFDRTVESTREGPLRDRLRDLSGRLEDGIQESWKIACRGDDIDGAISQLDTREAQAELEQVRDQIGREGSSPALESTLESLKATIESGQRMQRVSRSTRDRLRLLDARFDELVARAVEVSVGAGDSDVLGNDVDDLVTELESLRLAIDDTRRAEAGDSGQALPAPAPEDEPQTRPQTRPPTGPPR